MTDLPSDADLIAAVRLGDTDAYGQLYERHLPAAKRAASCLAKDAAAREDLVADAFARVLSALRAGNGPLRDFRPYLLVTLRNTAISIARTTSESLYAEVPDLVGDSAVGDPVLERWHASAAADAFASLPERWRMVLWHTEIEGESPATIAKRLGLSPNSVAALAYRAREGLRQAYLRAHLSAVEESDCRATVTKLAGWVRNSGPLGRRTSRHLASCSDCRGRADTLASVNNELRASVLPVLLLVAYLPAQTGLKATVMKFAAAAVVAATAATTVSSTPAVRAEQPAPVLSVPTRGVTVSTMTAPVTGTSTTQPPAEPAPAATEEPAEPAPAPAATTAPTEPTANGNGNANGNASNNGNGNGNNGNGNNGNGNAYGKGKEKKEKKEKDKDKG